MADIFPEEEIPYYNSFEEVIIEEDIVEVDVKISGWKRKFRIRALTFEQMDKINRLAAITKDDERNNIKAGDLDNKEFVFWTLVEGVVRPKMNIDQARKFSSKNGNFVEELVDEIWQLGRISKTQFDAYVEQVRRANEESKKSGK